MKEIRNVKELTDTIPEGDFQEDIKGKKLEEYADVLTAQEVSAILRVERKLGYQFLSSGKVDIFYVGKSIRVYKPKLIEFLSNASELAKKDII